MNPEPLPSNEALSEAGPLDADIVVAGFGPAAGGFLTTLARELPGLESRACPGLPPQVICYERADGLGFGVSGVVTRGRAIRATLPDFRPEEIPLATRVAREQVVYLLDPDGSTRRPWLMRAFDSVARLAAARHAIELPWIPPFLAKHDGFLASLGQFNQWVGAELMNTGLVQLWPGTPVDGPLVEDGRVAGVVLHGGASIRAALTVAADGPVGALGRALEMPPPENEWAVGMKMVVDLAGDCTLEEGMVVHTIGYPEPEIFGFLYVHPGRVASAGIFLPSWLRAPAATSYEYLQRFVLHPWLWRHLGGGRLRSWGAKSLNECGRRHEPALAGDGWARIGEGSGSTNVLTGSGVDEAWQTGIYLAEAVVEIYRGGLPFTRDNLNHAYVARRRGSALDRELQIAQHARDGFRRGPLWGFAGMALAGLTRGRLYIPAPKSAPERRWTPRPKAIPYDGQLLVSHQDALLLGGKVQGAPGAEAHVSFREAARCASCGARLCIPLCSGQAIHEGGEGLPAFDQEKCVHCGACVWNCTAEIAPGVSNISFRPAPGGLHSAEN